jgi:hypothetical protein
MNKLFIILLCLLTYYSSPAQKNLQSKNLKQLTFPSKIDTIASKGVTFYYNNLPDFLYECLVSPSDDTIDQKKFNRRLQIFIEGFFSSENWKYFQREQVDTTMGGVEGILVHGYSPSKPVGVEEFFGFFTNVKKTYYVILAGAKNELTSDLKKEIDRYLSSATFEGKNY